MNARDIQRALMADRYRRSFVLPNFTPPSWFECDVFELTAAGYFREYEIKLSRSDFKADALKRDGGWHLIGERWQRGEAETKHQKLARGETTGPNRFWFVVPDGLIFSHEVPDWAGLITCKLRRLAAPWNILFETVKPAPQLHRVKADPKARHSGESSIYYRYSNLFIYRREVKEEVAAAA